MPENSSEPIRPTLAPEAPFDPSARGSHVQQRAVTPNASPAARPSDRVQLVDKLGEIVGILVLGCLAWGGKVDGTLAAVLICAILGVNTGLRSLGARVPGAAAGLGVVGILAMQGAEILHHVLRARGLAVLAVVMLAAGLHGCSGALIKDPGAQIAVRLAWPSVHRGAVQAGLCDDDPPAYLVGETARRMDAGVGDASAAAPDDASSAAAGDGGAP